MNVNVFELLHEPDDLNQEAAAFWQRHAAALFKLGSLTESTRPHLIEAARLWGRAYELQVFLSREGRTFMRGQVICRRREARELNKVLNRHLAAIRKLGLTPLSLPCFAAHVSAAVQARESDRTPDLPAFSGHASHSIEV